MSDKPSEFVEALAKGIAILEAFDEARPEMTLSEVARATGTSPAAARRSLITLEALGYIGRKDKRFHLRPRILSLGASFYASTQIEQIVHPTLREIVEAFGDASSVGTLDGHDVIYVAHHSVQRARRAAAVVGARYPAFATSMGRVLLAGLSDADRAAYLESFDPVALTSKTCTDRDRLAAELAKVREDGYAVTVDQLDYGITALAVPLRDHAGRTFAALNTSGYTGMVTPEMLVSERLPTLRAQASKIAHEIARFPFLGSALGR